MRTAEMTTALLGLEEAMDLVPVGKRWGKLYDLLDDIWAQLFRMDWEPASDAPYAFWLGADA